MGSACSAKTTNRIQKIQTNPEFQQTRKFLSGLRSLRSLRKNKEPNLKNTNKPRIRANQKVSKCILLAPQKQQTKPFFQGPFLWGSFLVWIFFPEHLFSRGLFIRGPFFGGHFFVDLFIAYHYRFSDKNS